jgi:hypothetical protein
VRLTAIITAATLVAAAGCANAGPATAQAPASRPLAAFAARPVLVLPTRYLGPDGSLGWGAQIGDPESYLGDIDAEIVFALGARGVKNMWVFPSAIAASVRRNPTYAADPHQLAADWLRPPMKKPPEQLPEPIASQLRSLVALQEGAQYVLLPVEVRFEPVELAASATAATGAAVAADRAGRAVLRVVLLDARRSRIVWMGDVSSDPSSSFSPALAASAAEHLADLVAKP